MEFKYKLDLYPKVALIKAAYHFTDEFYVHLDEKDGYYHIFRFGEKLDGTAKGGIAITIADEFDMPIKFIGVGEGIEDLEEFDPETFIGGIFDE